MSLPMLWRMPWRMPWRMSWISCLIAGPIISLLCGARLEAFDHGRWQRILENHVSGDGWVDYRAIEKEAKGELAAYLKELGKASVDDFKSDAERKAFWINAYNAICMRKLLDHDLPDEVPHAFFFGKNIFTERTYRIAGKLRSLDDIEHGILRKKFDDNRLHATLVCGASSCPRLRTEAYTAERLDEQLDEECRQWVSVGKTKKGHRKNYLDRKKKTFYASKILDWYQEDFGDSEAGVLKFLRKYASESDAKFLGETKVRIRYRDYDWHLNSKPAEPEPD